MSSAAFYFIHRVVFHSHKASTAYKIIFNKYNPLAPLARWGRGIHLNHHREHIQSKRRGELEEELGRVGRQSCEEAGPCLGPMPKCTRIIRPPKRNKESTLEQRQPARCA